MGKRKRLPRFPHQYLFFQGLRIRRRLYKLITLLVPPQTAIYEKAQGNWASMAIYTACKMELADHLAEATKNIEELARLAGADTVSLYRLMRALSGEGIFKELPGKRFCNTRLSRAMMEGPDTIKYLILHQFNPEGRSSLSTLSSRVKIGPEAKETRPGQAIFDHMRDNPDMSNIYNKAMEQSSGMMALAILSAYDFGGIDTLVDIGGGRGILLSHILEAYLEMKGILFDLPHVNAPAEAVFLNNNTRERVQIISGDFFNEPPPSGHAYLMKNILHVFDDTDCIHLLKKIREVMDPKGKLIILETIVQSDNRPDFGKYFDLMMMIATDGGRERTREEYEDLFHRSGMKISRVIKTLAPFYIIEVVQD